MFDRRPTQAGIIERRSCNTRPRLRVIRIPRCQASIIQTQAPARPEHQSETPCRMTDPETFTPQPDANARLMLTVQHTDHMKKADHANPAALADTVTRKVLRACIRRLFPVVAFGLLAGCATEALDRAPPSAVSPWIDPELAGTDANVASKVSSLSSGTIPARSGAVDTVESVDGTGVQTLTQTRLDKPAAPSYRVASVPAITGLPRTALPDPGQTYGLVELIDLAQQNNPQTRAAWNHAREAALAVGMVEATFLPVLSANVLAGYQRTTFPSQLVIGPREFATDVSGVVPGLALGWLVLDFGQRVALLEAAQQLSRAANILFNAEHQRVIWSVTTRFYQYNLARERVRLARDSLASQQQIAQATRARLQAGMATTVETALSDQGVMQARLHLVNMQGLERSAYLGLLAAVGLSPTTEVRIAADTSKLATEQLRANTRLTDQTIEQAIASRPDVAASYAAMKAAQANIKAVEADFFPKVFLGGFLANSNTSFNLQGLPGFTQQANATGVLLGVTLPLYDGGLRNARLVGAQVRSEQATQNFTQLQQDAVREIVLAQTVLKSALDSEATAQDLVRTARVAYNAALESYQEGLATITMVTEAAEGVLHAREALLEARVAAEVAAANLAFAMGEMTSASQATAVTQRSLQ